jgi:ABC-type Fe3+-hydroxamate transport system substrate-binding protein
MRDGDRPWTPRALKRRAVLRALGATGALGALGTISAATGTSGFSTAALAQAATSQTAAGTPSRIIVLSWPLTEMLLSLGVAPIGVPAPTWYTSGIVEPPLPADVVDVGLLYQPNYDLLYELRPDLMVITPAHASVRASFERIAPTLTLGAYITDPQPYRAMRGEVLTLGRRLGRTVQAEALLARTEAVIDEARAALTGAHARLCVAQIVDDRHLRVYGAGSLFDEILQSLRLRNAAAEKTAGARAPLISSRMGASVIELEQLARIPDANLLWVDGGAPGALAGLQRNPVWRQLPFAQPGRAATLPVIAAQGALVSVQRFARAVAQVVPSMENSHAI